MPIDTTVYQYNAVIQSADKGGAYVPFPYDARSEFGKGREKFMPRLTGSLMRAVSSTWV